MHAKIICLHMNEDTAWYLVGFVSSLDDMDSSLLMDFESNKNLLVVHFASTFESLLIFNMPARTPMVFLGGKKKRQK